MPININKEHKAKRLNVDQNTELDWQNFLQLMLTNPTVSIAETVEIIGIKKSTVSNWRKERKTFMEKGYFEKHSSVAKHKVTGFPILRQARNTLRQESYADPEPETQGQLCEVDKELLQTILKVVKKSKEPDKLNKMVNHFWGENPNHVDYDIVLEDVEQVYEGF